MRIIFLLLACCITACKQQQPAKIISTAPGSTIIKLPPVECSNYAHKKTLATALLHDRTMEANQHQLQMSRFITDSLIPCWYGTPWDFNGCTTVPGKGSIACGYFVTTVLKDAGLQLNRIRLAQSPSGIIIHQLCSNIKMFCNQPLQNLVDYVQQQAPGLYIVGLDFHVGFIYFDGREVGFIHSSYYGPKCVVRENALAAAVLLHSKYRKIGRVNFMNDFISVHTH